MPKTLYYPAYVAPGRRSGGITWGKPHDNLVAACRWLDDEMKKIGSPWGTIVEFSRGEKIPLVDQVRPASARAACRRWEELYACTELDQ